MKLIADRLKNGEMAKLRGIPLLVRIPEISSANILKHLDVGAEAFGLPESAILDMEMPLQTVFWSIPERPMKRQCRSRFTSCRIRSFFLACGDSMVYS